MNKKIIAVLISFLLIPFSGFKINSDDNGLPVTGYIDITVESNVNKVLFTYPISESNIAPGRNDRKTSIVLPVKDFRCDNKIAYKDFINLLKADTYPELTIDLPGKVLQQIRERENVTLRNVTINIAGVSKKYDIVCTEEKAADGEKVLAGTIVVGLTDLHIDPPKKYFGMVKIKDEVIVKFGLGLKDQSYAQK